MSEVIATLKKDYIYNLMIKGKRQDGRGFKDFRDIKLETNVISKAEGSAKVTLGRHPGPCRGETSDRNSFSGFSG